MTAAQRHYFTAQEQAVRCPNKARSPLATFICHLQELRRSVLKCHLGNIHFVIKPLHKFTLSNQRINFVFSEGDSTEHRETCTVDGTSKTEQLCEQIEKISMELGKIDIDPQQIKILNNKANKCELMLNELWQEINASRDGLLVWKIDNVSQALKENQEHGTQEAGTSTPILSDFIYTGRYGYKLQAIAYLNGIGSGQGTHLSVYLSIHQGKYDGVLTWPFKQRVFFSLLDQSEDEETREHETKGLDCNRQSASFLRPTTSANPGWGFPKFIELETLQNGPYLKDDCIFLKIEVDPLDATDL